MNSRRALFGIFLILCSLLIVAGAYMICFRLPRVYYSKVTIEVGFDGGSIGMPNPSQLSPVDIPAQIHQLQSKEVILPVIDELKLGDKWAASEKSEAARYSNVLKMLKTQQVRNTNLVEVGVYGTEPQEAANIANTIAVQYRKLRIDQNQQQTSSQPVKIWEKAEPALRPVSPNVPVIMGYAAVAGFIFASVGIWLMVTNPHGRD